MKSLVKLLSSVVVVAPTVLRAADLVLAADGKTEYAVVVEEAAESNVRFAAYDLSRHLKRITGAEFPLVFSGTSAAPGGRRIEVGTVRANELAGKAWTDKLRHNGSLSLAAPDGDIVLTGADAWGITGAVYDFLEKELGCRWYSAWGDNKIPRNDRPVLKPFRHLVNPQLESRWVLVSEARSQRVRDGNLFLFRNGMNMTAVSRLRNVALPDGCGALTCEYVCKGNYCHSMFDFIPPHDRPSRKGYFKEHPEWFTYVKASGRRVDNRQLCLTNPALRRELTKNFLEYVDKMGGKAVYNISAMDVSGPFCECDGCQALVDRYGTPGAPLFDYLVEIGNVLARRNPDIWLSTLAYHRDQSQTPPNASFPPFPENILATFAPIDDDFSKPLTHPLNVRSCNDLKRWCKLVPRVWAWYYPIPYTTIYPYAGIRRMTADLRTMVAAGLKGTGYEHDVGLEIGANFYDMAYWVLTKTFREPQADVEALVKEYCHDCYGAAGDEVWAYWDELEKIRERYPDRVAWNGSFPKAFTPKWIAGWMRRLDAAEARLAEKPKARQRFREVRLGLYRMLLDRWQESDWKALGVAMDEAQIVERYKSIVLAGAGRRNVDPSEVEQYLKTR